MKSLCCCQSAQPPGQNRMMKGSLQADSGGVQGGVVRGVQAEEGEGKKKKKREKNKHGSTH